MRVAVAQLNPTVGDLEGNLGRIARALDASVGDRPDLVVFPELFLVGYPPRDLLEMPWFMGGVQKAFKKLLKLSQEYPATGIVVGAPTYSRGSEEKCLYNSAVLVCDGRVLLSQGKTLLPSYDVFDERRYFDKASEVGVVRFKGEVLGLSVCEDAWSPSLGYGVNPIKLLVDKDATLLVNISASPFHMGKDAVRYKLMRGHARRHRTPFIFVNQVGANDELVFDGRSMFFDRKGGVVALPSFRECVETIDTGKARGRLAYKPEDKIDSLRQALVLGIRDYMRKCGFKKAVVGLSGGIDSSVACCLAAEAVGRENVLGVSMPGPYSSRRGVDDARQLALNLGVELMVIPINSIYSSYVRSLSGPFSRTKSDITEENIQARIRGNLLMALSNKFGHLVLSTGNKSELSVGYCTLYGDMSGGLAVISDVPKTLVYKLARNINLKSKAIPESVFERPPSAELRSNQKDEDTLPPYGILDRILYYYIDERKSVSEIVRMKFDRKTVEWVVGRVNGSEYKRRQAAPGLKVTTKAFGIGRRMPIAARYEV